MPVATPDLHLAMCQKSNVPLSVSLILTANHLSGTTKAVAVPTTAALLLLHYPTLREISALLSGRMTVLALSRQNVQVIPLAAFV